VPRSIGKDRSGKEHNIGRRTSSAQNWSVFSLRALHARETNRSPLWAVPAEAIRVLREKRVELHRIPPGQLPLEVVYAEPPADLLVGLPEGDHTAQGLRDVIIATGTRGTCRPRGLPVRGGPSWSERCTLQEQPPPRWQHRVPRTPPRSRCVGADVRPIRCTQDAGTARELPFPRPRLEEVLHPGWLAIQAGKEVAGRELVSCKVAFELESRDPHLKICSHGTSV